MCKVLFQSYGKYNLRVNLNKKCNAIFSFLVITRMLAVYAIQSALKIFNYPGTSSEKLGLKHPTWNARFSRGGVKKLRQLLHNLIGFEFAFFILFSKPFERKTFAVSTSFALPGWIFIRNVFKHHKYGIVSYSTWLNI